tara:strand:+ start:14 stop:1123 length:1110 start_codon:yes stop_codon:yes gene_type:complete
MISNLLKTDCIRTGKFTLKNGEISKYYFDMKLLVSYPELLKSICNEIYNLIDERCDLLCGVPIGGLPVCSYISINYNIPMIMVRDEVKSYGTQKQIEGNYDKKNKCIIIEDVVTSGGSVQKVIDILEDKVEVIGVITILDRQQGHNCSVPVKSLFSKTDIVKEKLNSLIEIKKSRLCFSADLDSKEDLIKILENIGQYIVICKIHYDFYDDKDDELKNKLIELSINHDFLIIEDRKFIDISNTVKKQYRKYSNWVDMVTVMGNVNEEVIKNLSGVLLVANMSNNSFNCTDNSIELANKYSNHIVGFITQNRINLDNMICMTPGVNINTSKDKDQNYRSLNDIDTDIIIVGRGIYNQKDYENSAKIYSDF